MSERLPVVFLVDVDNTLLDNDHIQNDLQRDMCSSSAELTAAAASGEDFMLRSAQSGRCWFHHRRQYGYLIFRRFARLLCASYAIRSPHFSPG
jgi:hypothetical protein